MSNRIAPDRPKPAPRLRPVGPWVLVLTLAGLAQASSAEFPHVKLEAGEVQATVMLPDPEKGYSRGSRFDRSGQIESVRWNGRLFFGPWGGPEDPTHPEHVTGNAEAFDDRAHPTFDRTPVGRAFVKLGVGVLVRPDDRPYAPNRRYELLDPGEWQVAHGVNWVSSTHIVGHDRWKVAYAKRVELQAEPPAVLVHRRLDNLGEEHVVTEHYVHHFLRIDADEIGPVYEILFSFEPVIESPRLRDVVMIDGSRVAFTHEIPAGKSIYAVLSKSEPAVACSATVINRRTGSTLTIRPDPPASQWALFAVTKALAPECFTPISLPPGESFTWSTTYLLGVTDER